MVMKVRLEWFDKLTENLEADEYSANVEEDSILKALDLHNEPQIYAGGFNVLPNWIAILQPNFQHAIEPNLFDYQISFRYQGTWPPPPRRTKE
jgi:Cloacin immunity protein